MEGDCSVFRAWGERSNGAGRAVIGLLGKGDLRDTEAESTDHAVRLTRGDFFQSVQFYRYFHRE